MTSEHKPLSHTEFVYTNIAIYINKVMRVNKKFERNIKEEENFEGKNIAKIYLVGKKR